MAREAPPQAHRHRQLGKRWCHRPRALRCPSRRLQSAVAHYHPDRQRAPSRHSSSVREAILQARRPLVRVRSSSPQRVVVRRVRSRDNPLPRVPSPRSSDQGQVGTLQDHHPPDRRWSRRGTQQAPHQRRRLNSSREVVTVKRSSIHSPRRQAVHLHHPQPHLRYCPDRRRCVLEVRRYPRDSAPPRRRRTSETPTRTTRWL